MAIVCLHQDDPDRTEIYVNLDHVLLMVRTGEATFIRFASSSDGSYKSVNVREAPAGILELAEAGRPRY